MKCGLSDQQLKEIKNILASYSEIEEALLFGSRAIDTYKEASDVDIAIKGKDVDFTFAAKLKNHFEEETYLPFFFDVFSYSSIFSEELKEHINTKGVSIYDKSTNDWEIKHLKEIAQLEKNSWKVGQEPLPYIGLEHIIEGGLRIRGIGDSTTVASNKYRFDSDNFLFGKLRPYFRKLYRPSFSGICSTDIWVVRAKNESSKDYLFYFFANKEFIDLSYSGSSGTRMPRADWEFISEKKWNFPPLPEQKSIAEVLSSLDDKIDLLHRQNKTLETIAQTLFRQWFIEETQDDWEVIELGKFVKCITGYSYRSANLNPSNIALVTLKNFSRDGSFRIDGYKEYVGDFKNEQIVKQGDLVVAHTDITQEAEIVGNPVLVIQPLRYNTLVITMDIMKVESMEEWLSREFLYYLFKSVDFKNHCLGCTNGTTVLHMSRKTIPSYKFKIPNRIKIISFTKTIKSNVDKIFCNIAMIESLKNLRDTLLPKLMNGKVRVKPMTTKIEIIKSFLQFQEAIRSLEGDQFVYRGQSNEDWSVNSSAYRRLSENEKKKPVPNELIKYNKVLIDNARNYDEASKSETDLELLTHLQHKGIATSLIDFSNSALIALWFACQDSTKDGKIFCLDTADPNVFLVITSEDKKEPIEKILTLDLRGNKNIKTAKWQPTFNSNFIISQHSVFIFNKLDKIKNEDFFKVLTIPKNYKTKILKDLKKLSDITEIRIFPGFDGFVRSNAHNKPYETETAKHIFERALDHHQAGRFEEAIKDYNRAIELDPDYVEVYNNRGIAKATLERFEDAMADFDLAIKLESISEQIYCNRGIAKVALGRFDAAIEDYDQAIKLNTGFVEAYNHRGLAKATLACFDAAIEDYDQAIELKRNYAVAYTNRGIAKAALKQFEEAIKDYNRAIELNPDDVAAYNNRGNSKAGLKQFEEAIKDYNRAIELAPDNAEVYNNRGATKVGLKQFGEAIEDYNKAIELNPGYANAYNNRGIAKISLKQHEEAIKDLEQARDMYNKQGNLEKAKRCQERIDALKTQ